MNINGLRTIVGSPVFDYQIEKIGDSPDGSTTLYTLDEIWQIMQAANTNNYIMSVGTSGSGDDSVKNNCGIAKSHAYSIIDVFTMTDSAGTTHKMLMVRNPWGVAYYN